MSSTKKNKFTLLGGRTGYISKISDHGAIITDNIYGDISFNEDVLKFSIKGRKGGFRSCFYINQVVYFDLEIDDLGTGVCRGVWIGRKELSNFDSGVTEPVFATTKPEELMERRVYKGTVAKMRPPYAFIVELEESKIPVFVFNQAFKPALDAPKLSRDEPVCLYVSKGDTVYVTVYKNSQEKEFKWSAWDAWMEDDNISVTSTCSEESRKTKKQRRRKRTKTGEKNDILKGKLSFVGSKTAQLDSREHNGSVFFHRDNTFLFGIPMKQLNLDSVFRKGEELNYIMSDENEGEASCVWLGSQDAVLEDVKERMVSIIKYCQTRGIEDASVLTILAHELHKQWSSFKEEQKHIEKEDETYDCSVSRVYERTTIENNVSKEVNTNRGSEFKVNQANLNHQDQNSTKTNVDANIKNMFSTPSSQIEVKKSESSAMIKTENNQTASSTTNITQIQNCEQDQNNIWAPIPKQNYETLDYFIKESASVMSTSKNVFSEFKENINTVDECKKENTELLVSKYNIPNVKENVTITLETQDIACNAKVPVDLVTGNSSQHISQNSTQLFTSDAKPALGVSVNVLKMQNTNDKNEAESDVESALDISTNVLETQHTSDENEPESDLELGLNMSENVLEMQHVNDQNEEFGVPLMDKTVAHNLQLSLMSVLEKELGKTATQILAPHVISSLEKELTKHMMQELMEKALSSVIDNITEEGNGNVGDMQNTDGEVNGMTKVSTMVQEWKQEMMLIVEQQKSHDGDIGRRILKYSHDNDKNNTSTPEESSTLLGFLRDNTQLQNQTFHHIDRIPICNEIGSSTKVLRDQESQTISTGRILYLKYLPDT